MWKGPSAIGQMTLRFTAKALPQRSGAFELVIISKVSRRDLK